MKMSDLNCKRISIYNVISETQMTDDRQGNNSARHRSQDICPPISQIVLKYKNQFIIKECPEEILIKLAIVLKISKSS